VKCIATVISRRTLLKRGACAAAVAAAPATARRRSSRSDAFLHDVQRRTFRFFWETTNPANGLAADRWPTRSFASIAATGFALSALPVGVERGFVGRRLAAERALTTLRFFAEAPQGPAASGMTGYKGFFYHFLDPATGARFGKTELSTIDTALLLAGALLVKNYFDRPAEKPIGEVPEILEGVAAWIASRAA